MKVYVSYVLISIDEFEILRVFDSEEKAKKFINGKDTHGEFPPKKYFYEEKEVE